MPPYQAILHTALTASGHVVFKIENEDADVSLLSPRNIADGRWHQVVASWGEVMEDGFGRLPNHFSMILPFADRTLLCLCYTNVLPNCSDNANP